MHAPVRLREACRVNLVQFVCYCATKSLTECLLTDQTSNINAVYNQATIFTTSSLYRSFYY